LGDGGCGSAGDAGRSGQGVMGMKAHGCLCDVGLNAGDGRESDAAMQQPRLMA